MNSIIGLASNFVVNGTLLAAQEGYVIKLDKQLLMQLIPHALNVLLLFYILAKLLFNPVREILKKRKERIASELNNIKSEKEKTDVLKKEYEGKLENINQEAEEILKEAHKKAVNKEKQIVSEANEEAERILNRAKLEIEREKQKARDELKKEIVQITTIMASKFVVSAIDNDTQNRLIEETVNEMGDSTWLD